MSSALVLGSTNTAPLRPLSTIEANLDDFVVRVPNNKLVKYVRIMKQDEQITHMAPKCLELESEQLYEIKSVQGHAMSGTTSKAIASGFQWLADRTDVVDCLCEARVDGVTELFLRACTRPPNTTDKAELKAYENDQMILWRLNTETLRLIKTGVLSKEACPYPEIHNNKHVYTYFKKTKEVEVDNSPGGATRTYLETNYPRILDFAEAKNKTITMSLAASKKTLGTKLDKVYEQTQMPTDKLLRGHFNLLNNVTGVKRGVGDVLCFEIMNSNAVQTTRLGDRTIVMITPTHDATEAGTSLAVDDEE